MTPVRARNLQETRITSLDEVRPLGRPRFRHWDLLSNFAGRQFRAGWRHADRHDRRALGVADAVNSCVQERVALPSICKVRAPPSAMPQPNFVPVMPSPLRNTQSSGVSPSTSTLPVRDEPAQLMQENQGRFSCSHSPRRGWLHRLY